MGPPLCRFPPHTRQFHPGAPEGHDFHCFSLRSSEISNYVFSMPAGSLVINSEMRPGASSPSPALRGARLPHALPLSASVCRPPCERWFPSARFCRLWLPGPSSRLPALSHKHRQSRRNTRSPEPGGAGVPREDSRLRIQKRTNATRVVIKSPQIRVPCGHKASSEVAHLHSWDGGPDPKPSPVTGFALRG